MTKERNDFIVIRSLHGDGSPHRTWTKVLRTPDPWVFYIPRDSVVREADGREWTSPYPVVGLFYPDKHYQVFLLLKPELTDYYCNIITPPVWNETRTTVEFHDLDLDIVVKNHQPVLLDEDEFEGRKDAYFHHWVEQASFAKEELWGQAVNQTGPFHPAVATTWREYARRQGQI